MSDLLSEHLQTYIEVLDHEKASDTEDTPIDINKMVRLTTSSLEGFAHPVVEKVHSLLKRDPETWRWLADDFYTREVIDGIRGMVGRFLKLTPVLAGVVPSKGVNIYLREASRCFIYGFFQACIAMSRAALEAGLNEHIKRKLGAIPKMDLAEKIDKAARLKLVSLVAASLAHRVRISGREVLHQKPAKQNRALDTLVQTRAFLMELYEK